MTNYLAVIDTTVLGGLPCQIAVTDFLEVPPWRGNPYDCPSDRDWYGYSYVEWEILDRRGRPAPWIKKRLSAHEEQTIERIIKEYRNDD